MEISSTSNFVCNTSKNNLNFKAIPIAKYSVGKNSYVKVVELEKNDLPFVSKFLKNIKYYFKDKKIKEYSRCEVMKEAFSASEKILSSPDNIKGKARIFLAISDSNPCGILIGNVLKESKTHKFAYSSRKNHSSRETELDWLATWNPFKNKTIKGIGKIITAEYYNTLKKDRFKSVFVRSEVPELSCATEFYKKMGFEKLAKNRESIIKSSSNRYLIGDYDVSNEQIVPMVASIPQIRKIKKEIFELFNRKSLFNSSIDIDNIIK